MKANCYKCQYRGTIPGDTHSCCKHPALGEKQDLFNLLEGIMSGIAQKAANELQIMADKHGIQNGWFMWPANFDPAWLTNCNGFTEK